MPKTDSCYFFCYSCFYCHVYDLIHLIHDLTGPHTLRNHIRSIAKHLYPYKYIKSRLRIWLYQILHKLVVNTAILIKNNLNECIRAKPKRVTATATSHSTTNMMPTTEATAPAQAYLQPATANAPAAAPAPFHETTSTNEAPAPPLIQTWNPAPVQVTTHN